MSKIARALLAPELRSLPRPFSDVVSTSGPPNGSRRRPRALIQNIKRIARVAVSRASRSTVVTAGLERFQKVAQLRPVSVSAAGALAEHFLAAAARKAAICGAMSCPLVETRSRESFSFASEFCITEETSFHASLQKAWTDYLSESIVIHVCRRDDGDHDMLSIRLPESIESCLDALAKEAGRSKSYYVREAILEHLDDIEDVYLAERVLERLRWGEEETVSLKQVIENLGLDD